jgi:hypothetical protein
VTCPAKLESFLGVSVEKNYIQGLQFRKTHTFAPDHQFSSQIDLNFLCEWQLLDQTGSEKSNSYVISGPIGPPGTKCRSLPLGFIKLKKIIYNFQMIWVEGNQVLDHTETCEIH